MFKPTTLIFLAVLIAVTAAASQSEETEEVQSRERRGAVKKAIEKIVSTGEKVKYGLHNLKENVKSALFKPKPKVLI